MLLLVWAAWRPDSDAHQRTIGMASIVLVGFTMLFTLWWAARFVAVPGPGAIALDNFRWFADVVILLGTLFTIGLSMDDNMRSGITAAETHVLVLLASSGMMLLVAARDLMIVFLGIELMSISVYALAGINRRSERSAEGALKYFLLGAFSTAFLLYGIALVYGATGTTNLTLIAERTVQYDLVRSPLLVAGIALMLVGFGFKVATVPFHMWAPDVYDGAPSPITAYMAATVKAAAFVAFVRVWLEAFPASFTTWLPAVSGLADRHDGHRQRDRPRAEESQAPARVLEHRPRRLSARRARRRARSRARRRCCSICSSTRWRRSAPSPSS